MKEPSHRKILERRKPLMALLKLRRFFQLTLPAELRKQFNLAEGDYLEAEAVEGGILLKPVAVVGREKAWNKVFEVMERVHARQPRRKKSPEQAEQEIATMVKDFRKKHA
jgi:AbrB family looped-hinge helix DNA binding protein